MSIANRLQRAHLSRVEPYASARRSMSGGNVWLNANESPFCNDYSVSTDNLNRYPAFQSTALNQAYADYAGVEQAQVMSCRGSDEAIDLLIRAFTEPAKDNVMICPPTYGMYAISAQTHGAGVIEVPLQKSDWQLDVAAIKQQLPNTKLVFLCSPSNPLGNSLALADIEAVLNAAKNALVVVDEAYIEFSSQDSVAGWLDQYPNLVVLRTLSKAYALAGARCGFALAQADVLDVLRKVLAPYPLPDMTVQVAQQALSANGQATLKQQVGEILEQRETMVRQLAQLPVQLIANSDTNFVLIEVGDAASLVRELSASGVLLRNQSAQRGLNDCVRITIGNADENRQVMRCLKQFFGVKA